MATGNPQPGAARKAGDLYRVDGSLIARRPPELNDRDFLESQRGNLRDADLRGWKAPGVDLSGEDLRGADLTDGKFPAGRFDGCLMDETTAVRDADLDHASMRYSRVPGADFGGSAAAWLDLTGSAIDKTRFENTDLHNAWLDETRGYQTRFARAIVSGTTYNGAALEEPDFSDAVFANGKDMRTQRAASADRTAGARITRGWYGRSVVPDSWPAMAADADLSRSVASAPVRAVLNVTPKGGALKGATGFVLNQVKDLVAEHTGVVLYNRIMPDVVQRAVLSLAIRTGAYDLYRRGARFVKDGVRIMQGVFNTDRAHAARRALGTLGEIEPRGNLSERLAARKGRIGPVVVCSEAPAEDVLDIIAMHRRGVPSCFAVTLTSPAATPDRAAPAAIRFDASGMAAAWFDGETFLKTVQYDRDGKPMAVIAEDGATRNDANTLSAQPDGDQAGKAFFKHLGYHKSDAVRTSPATAIALAESGLAAPWAPEQYETIWSSGSPRSVFSALPPFLETAAEKARAEGDNQTLMRARAVLASLDESNWRDDPLSRSLKLMEMSGDVLRASAAKGGAFADELEVAAGATDRIIQVMSDPTLLADLKAAPEFEAPRAGRRARVAQAEAGG